MRLIKLLIPTICSHLRKYYWFRQWEHLRKLDRAYKNMLIERDRRLTELRKQMSAEMIVKKSFVYLHDERSET